MHSTEVAHWCMPPLALTSATCACLPACLLTPQLHAKTSIRDTSFFFRLKQGEGGPAASDARFVYG